MAIIKSTLVSLPRSVIGAEYSCSICHSQCTVEEAHDLPVPGIAFRPLSVMLNLIQVLIRCEACGSYTPFSYPMPKDHPDYYTPSDKG